MNGMYRTVSVVLFGMLLGGAFLSTAANDAYAQDLLEGAKQATHLIVMISGEVDSVATIGAGIIFGTQADRLYIATANHVVRRGEHEAQNVQVQFKSLPGERVAATLLSHVDPGLDLAVLSVRGLNELTVPPASLPFNRLGEVSILARGASVHSLGYPNGEPWQVNVTPEVFVGRSGDLLYYESNVVAPGHSGGGLFNENWELLGMIRADQPPRGVAVSFDRLLERLGAWGYPLQFKIAAGISGRWASGTGQMAFTFKVLGNELFGIVEVARKDQEKEKKGILDGRQISHDRISFYTVETRTLTERDTQQNMNIGGGLPTYVTRERTEKVKTLYRGTIAGDEIEFIEQSEDGSPPREFRVRRVVTQ